DSQLGGSGESVHLRCSQHPGWLRSFVSFVRSTPRTCWCKAAGCHPQQPASRGSPPTTSSWSPPAFAWTVHSPRREPKPSRNRPSPEASGQLLCHPLGYLGLEVLS
uniref:Uncharacterized protein n=1 Tax=Mustela putorius furo TaxID=9669 RepID=M3YLL7_MUSPF